MSNYYDNAVHNNHSKHITINLSDDRAEAFLHDFLRDDDLPLWKNKEEKIKYLLDTQSAESGFSFLLDYHDDKHPYPVEEGIGGFLAISVQRLSLILMNSTVCAISWTTENVRKKCLR